MKKVLIIGGGFFGMYFAEHLTKKGYEVVLVEKSEQLMRKASYNNQARVHNGYHYPRSILTALRSRVTFPRFVKEFNDCVVSDFEKYYLIGGPLGKVTATQFQKFCARIGAPCDPAPVRIQNFVRPEMITAVYETVEYAFNAVTLKDVLEERLRNSNVKVRLNTSAEHVQTRKSRLLCRVKDQKSGEEDAVEVDHVFNCTYSAINYLPSQSGIELIPLKHEMTEMCLVEVPEEFRHLAFTVMCGPFFSVMPFPAEGLHSFSHVRYTPHYEWYEGGQNSRRDSYNIINQKRHSAWHYMQKDAERYIPLLSECKYKRSLWEIKTVLPRSEVDDSRPILFRANHGIKGFHCVMGGKIDNVYDAVQAIDKLVD